ncbi:MAG: hypothetical protein Q9218_007068 [Villophora microphyllina]
MPSREPNGILNSRMAGMKLDSSGSSRPAPKLTFADKLERKAKEDGQSWTTVTHNKPPIMDKLTPPNGQGNRPRNTSTGEQQRWRPGALSSAAHSRLEQYQHRNKADSHTKQSALPVNERDPELLEQEKNRGKIFPKSFFRPGMIIRGVVHEQDYVAASAGSNITVTEKNPNFTNSRYGPICTKQRKMIIIGLSQDHYTAIPLFTHNGKGLANKVRPEEFVSIKDHRSKDKTPPLSMHKALLTEAINNGIDTYDVKSTAHVTYALPRKYDLPIVHEGCLRKDSTNALIDLFYRYAPKKIVNRDGRVL